MATTYVFTEGPTDREVFRFVWGDGQCDVLPEKPKPCTPRPKPYANRQPRLLGGRKHFRMFRPSPRGMVFAPRIGMRSASQLLAIVLILQGCGQTAPEKARWTSCPTAPLNFPQDETACDFPGECYYAPPHIGSDGTADTCNDMWVSCVDGGLEFRVSTVLCVGKAPACDAGTVEQQPCSEPTNGECAESFTDAGAVDTICACGKPGPVWRCVRTGDAG